MVKNHSVVPHISYLLQKHSNDSIQVRKYLKNFVRSTTISVISGSFWNYFFIYCEVEVARDSLNKIFQILVTSPDLRTRWILFF